MDEAWGLGGKEGDSVHATNSITELPGGTLPLVSSLYYWLDHCRPVRLSLAGHSANSA
jgi:hypothetical protein